MAAMPNRPTTPSQASLFDAEPAAEAATANQIPTGTEATGADESADEPARKPEHVIQAAERIETGEIAKRIESRDVGHLWNAERT